MIRTKFGTNTRGEPVVRYTLTNLHGMSLSVMNHGATILSLHVPDVHGHLADVVLGHDAAAEYSRKSAFFGPVVGRYANRIRGGTFTLDGRTFHLLTNDGLHTLHGGPEGFDCARWREGPTSRNGRLVLRHTSPDGDQGFPGKVEVKVVYELTSQNELRIEYEAWTTAATPFSVTNHAYFNLRGHDAGDCLDHLLTLDADAYLPVDESLIPTGEKAPVVGTPFDFCQPRPLGTSIRCDHPQLRRAGGYDHTFCLRPPDTGSLRRAAHVFDPFSGRAMTVFTTEPGVQLYTGNQFDGNLTGKGGCRYGRHAGFCLETQRFPDSPNQPGFPDAILRPGQTFRSVTVYGFSATG